MCFSTSSADSFWTEECLARKREGKALGLDLEVVVLEVVSGARLSILGRRRRGRDDENGWGRKGEGVLPWFSVPHLVQVNRALVLPDEASSRLPHAVQKMRVPMAAIGVKREDRKR